MAKVRALIEGYREFFDKYFASQDPLYQQLAEVGQAPKTLVIACSDSRVDPSIITSAGPGDIFVIRNVANLVPPCERKETGLHGVSAALEFAVRVLEVEHIVVLGHSNCAGINALLNSDKIKKTDFIGNWVNVALAAKEKTLKMAPEADEHVLQHHCEQESIILSLDNLMTFPWISARVKKKSLKLHGWYFSLEDGHLLEYRKKKGKFETIPTIAKQK